MKILILEDEILLAIDLAETLEARGHEIMGPFSTAAHAIRACTDEKPDVALLDFNLGNDATSEPVADHLTAERVPFVFLTGYRRDFLPKRFSDTPIAEKPVSTGRLDELLNGELFGE